MELLRKFRAKYILISLLTLALFILLTRNLHAQHTNKNQFDRALTTSTDTIPGPLTAPPKIVDTLPISKRDSIIAVDTSGFQSTDTAFITKVDTFSVKISKDTLSAPIHYYADDSAVVMITNKKIFLYGKTKTDYEDVTLKAPKVEIDQQTQLLYAYNAKDSLGYVSENAELKTGEQTVISDTIQYNIRNQKGISKQSVTQMNEMFIHLDVAKKVSTDVTYGLRGGFTTCNLDVPHYQFLANKIKVVNKKLAVSGPTHPEFEGVPIPIYLPFGYFPLSQGRHSGFLRPTFETNEFNGVGLTGIGYYKVFNDYWDGKIYGDVYSYGGWSMSFNPTYRKRYHYQGNLIFSILHSKFNFKGDPDFSKNNNYSIIWGHQSDSRARPGVNFTASVNASSTGYNKRVTNNVNTNFQNLLGSSITYSKTWQDPKQPFNLTLSATHSQNNNTRLVQLSVPNVGFTIGTIRPFENPEAITPKWYEQLGIGYNGTFANQISFYDTAFTVQRFLDTVNWGAQHNIPISVALPPIANGAVTITPGISYSQVWVAQKTRHTWNNTAKQMETTTEKGFFVDQQASFSLSFNTALFGTYDFKRGNIEAIRHTIRPTVSLTYKPDLSKKFYYDAQVDSTGRNFIRFTELEGRGGYGGYGEGRFGGLTFQIDNNLEAKIRQKRDTTDGEPSASNKVRLLDGYGVSTGYNFFADSMKLSPLQFYLRSSLFNKINLNVNATLNPYQSDSLGRNTGKYAWDGGRFSPGRISNGGVSLSTSFKSKPKDTKKDEERKSQERALRNDPAFVADQQRLLEYMRQNPAEFVDFNFSWAINLAYSFNFASVIKPDFSGFENSTNSTLNLNGSFSLSPKWQISMDSYIDVKERSVETLTMSISRDMHCWQMSISVAPVSPYRYFNFTISPKSGLLQDLKINRTRTFYRGY